VVSYKVLFEEERGEQESSDASSLPTSVITGGAL